MAKPNFKHGMWKTPEFNVWCGMIKRCGSKNNKDFDRYGGRGIKVHERWHEFSNFIADMGLRPSPKLTIERIDRNGDYCKENCAWETQKKQQNNRSNNRIVIVNGVSMTLSQACEATGARRNIVNLRLLRGWPIERALMEPPHKNGRNQPAPEPPDPPLPQNNPPGPKAPRRALTQ